MKVSTSIALLLIFAAGCGGAGLSHRHSDGHAFSSHVMSLFDAAQLPERGPVNMRLPAAIAVAQLGEVTPPSAMLDRLRREHGVFVRVESVPALFGTEDMLARQYAPYQMTTPFSPRPSDPASARQHMKRLIDMARSTGADYLLVYGGTADYEARNNSLILLDLTVVGAFVVPSNVIHAEARAGAAMVDLRSGRVALMTSADAKRDSFTSTATLDAEQRRVIEKVREAVMAKLGDQVVADCKRRMNEPARAVDENREQPALGGVVGFERAAFDAENNADADRPIANGVKAVEPKGEAAPARPAPAEPHMRRYYPKLTTRTHYEF